VSVREKPKLQRQSKIRPPLRWQGWKPPQNYISINKLHPNDTHNESIEVAAFKTTYQKLIKDWTFRVGGGLLKAPICNENANNVYPTNFEDTTIGKINCHPISQSGYNRHTFSTNPYITRSMFT